MPYGILLYLFVRLMLSLNKKDEPIPEMTRATVEAVVPDNHIQYISNGKLLNQPHVCYYVNLLNLNETSHIDCLTIEEAAENRRMLINKANNEQMLVSSRDVAAAKFFLLDQWAYLTSQN